MSQVRSKRVPPRVLHEIGFDTVSYATIKRSLGRIQEQDYRDQITRARFAYSVATTELSLLLYDLTWLISLLGRWLGEILKLSQATFTSELAKMAQTPRRLGSLCKRSKDYTRLHRERAAIYHPVCNRPELL